MMSRTFSRDAPCWPLVGNWVIGSIAPVHAVWTDAVRVGQLGERGTPLPTQLLTSVLFPVVVKVRQGHLLDA